MGLEIRFVAALVQLDNSLLSEPKYSSTTKTSQLMKALNNNNSNKKKVGTN